ncbi:twin-arginine translocase TatA/TatE family subunit [Streptomyces corynorhini]|uniref:Sec-independent protein translocase TatA n=1 Tax=Streptomyces corynorhini TaxID=2282652 RepID=A0A370B734_9ACTN|nr:twin-arginine translocase TatA/TatE family subunit [Streptomyces corynorhini]RDG36462.1 Sec-independent protein translocase TatA [Streptomyces corynorhini]
MFGFSELALILLVIFVIVGVKKLPELTRSAGKAARIFKSEKAALKEDGRGDGAAAGSARAGEPGAGRAGRRIVTGVIVDRDRPPTGS